MNGPITERRWLCPHSVMNTGPRQIFKENRTGQHEILQCQGRWCWPGLIRSSGSNAAGEWFVLARCLLAYVPFSGIPSTVRALVVLVSGTHFRKRLIVMLSFVNQKKNKKQTTTTTATKTSCNFQAESPFLFLFFYFFYFKQRKNKRTFILQVNNHCSGLSSLAEILS